MYISSDSFAARMVAVALGAWLLVPGSAMAALISPAAVLMEAGREDLSRDWQLATRLETQARRTEISQPQQSLERYLQAATLFDGVIEGVPTLTSAYWRSSRMYWAAGEMLPDEAVDLRVEYFGRAEARASRGLEIDSECAECMLWKFASMGRMRTTQGVLTGIKGLPDMADLLERGIELEPEYADGPENSTLGNLHYSSAIFYRIFPDWFWLGWVLGVKGDKDRALEHSRSALAIHPNRLDYQIELGCQLLCLGASRDDEIVLREGQQVIQTALLREPETQDDEREIAAARVMLAEPKKSCGYSGDAWIEINGKDARRAAVSANRASQ